MISPGARAGCLGEDTTESQRQEKPATQATVYLSWARSMMVTRTPAAGMFLISSKPPCNSIDLLGNGEAKAGAFARGLGGEEGIENLRRVFLGDAGAAVFDFRHHCFFANPKITRQRRALHESGVLICLR